MRKNNVKSTKQTGVYGDKVLAGVIQERITTLLGKKGGEWIGNMSELDAALRSVSRAKVPNNWPSSPSVMRRLVNKVVFTLRRSENVGVKFSRTTDHMRKRVVEFVQR